MVFPHRKNHRSRIFSGLRNCLLTLRTYIIDVLATFFVKNLHVQRFFQILKFFPQLGNLLLVALDLCRSPQQQRSQTAPLKFAMFAMTRMTACVAVSSIPAIQ